MVSSTMLGATVLSFFLASALAGDFTSITGDDPSIQVVKNVITRANQYLEDHLLTEVKLPDIGGLLPTDVVTLSDGRIGEFNTLVLQGDPGIQKRGNTDGSTTYLFDIKLALQELGIQYQFKVKVIGIVVGNGTVTVIPEENAIGAKGIVVVREDGQCDATFYGVAIDKLDGIKVVIKPDNIPGLNTFYENILNFVTPQLIPVTNLALKGAVLSPYSQSVFSQFVCNEFNRPTVVPSTRIPTDPTTFSTVEPSLSTTEKHSDATTERTYPTTERSYSTTERSYPSTERSYSTTERETPSTERIYSTTERGYPSTERGYSTTERGYQSTERGYSTTERSYSTTERSYPSTERSYSTTERSYPSTERSYPSTERSYPSTERY